MDTFADLWLVAFEGHANGEETPSLQAPLVARREGDRFVLCMPVGLHAWEETNGAPFRYTDGPEVVVQPGRHLPSSLGEGTFVKPVPARPGWVVSIYGRCELSSFASHLPIESATNDLLTQIGTVIARYESLQDGRAMLQSAATEARRRVATEADPVKRADAAWWLTRASSDPDDAIAAAVVLREAHEPDFELPLDLARPPVSHDRIAAIAAPPLRRSSSRDLVRARYAP